MAVCALARAAGLMPWRCRARRSSARRFRASSILQTLRLGFRLIFTHSAVSFVMISRTAGMFGMLGLGFGAAIIMVPSQTLLQEESPPGLLSRVSSSMISLLAISRVVAIFVAVRAEQAGIRNLYMESAVMLVAIGGIGHSNKLRKPKPALAKTAAADSPAGFASTSSPHASAGTLPARQEYILGHWRKSKNTSGKQERKRVIIETSCAGAVVRVSEISAAR